MKFIESVLKLVPSFAFACIGCFITVMIEYGFCFDMFFSVLLSFSLIPLARIAKNKLKEI